MLELIKMQSGCVMVYGIAGVFAEIAIKTEYCKNAFSPFLADAKPDFCIDFSKQQITAVANDQNCSIAVAESYLILQDFSQKLFKKTGAVLFHASAINVGGRAILFCAPSGTGKSTHSALWKKSFADVEYLNDDKPFIVRERDGFYCYGSPWCGKHGLGSNKKAKVFAVCKVCRAQENSCQKLTTEQFFSLALNQTVRFDSAENMDRLFGFLQEFLNDASLFQINVNVNADAPKVVRKAILGDI